MKITQNDPNVLRMTHYPIADALFFGVLSCTALSISFFMRTSSNQFVRLAAYGLAGLGIFKILSGLGKCQVKDFCFDRTIGQLTVEFIGLFDRKTVQYPLRDVLKAEVAAFTDSDGTTYRAQILLHHQEPIPLTFLSTSGRSEPQKLVDRINAFLAIKP